MDCNNKSEGFPDAQLWQRDQDVPLSVVTEEGWCRVERTRRPRRAHGPPLQSEVCERKEINAGLLGQANDICAFGYNPRLPTEKHRTRKPLRSSRRPRGRTQAFDATCGYPGEGPSPDSWTLVGPVTMAGIRNRYRKLMNLSGNVDGALASELHRLRNEGRYSNDALTEREVELLWKAWPSAAPQARHVRPPPPTIPAPVPKKQPPAAVKPHQAGPAAKPGGAANPPGADIESKQPFEQWTADDDAETHRKKSYAEIARGKRDQGARRAADVRDRKLRDAVGPDAAATADALDPTLVPAIEPIGGEDLPVPAFASDPTVVAFRKDCDLYDDILDKLRFVLQTKCATANLTDVRDVVTVKRILIAESKTLGFVDVDIRIRRFQRTLGSPENCCAEEIIFDLIATELSLHCAQRCHVQHALYNEGDGLATSSFLGFTARNALEATVCDGLRGSPNRNEYVLRDAFDGRSPGSAAELAKTQAPSMYRRPGGVAGWKLRVADSGSRSAGSAVVALFEEAGKKLISSAAVKVALAVCPATHVAAAAAVTGYVIGSAAVAAVESVRQPSALSFGARFLGHFTFGISGHIGTAAHVAYNAGVSLVGRSDLTLSMLHSARSQPTECLDGVLRPALVNPDASLKTSGTVCSPSFGVQRLIQVGDYTQVIARQCTHNAEIALTHRVLRPLPMHARLTEVAAHWRKFDSCADDIAARVGSGPPLEFFDWLNRYSGGKKRLFANMRDARPHEEHSTRAKVFIKAEKSPRTVLGAKIGAPRVISGCPEELTYHTGRHLTAMAKRAVAGLREPRVVGGSGGQGRIFYTCGLDSEGIGDAFAEAISHVEVPEGDQLVFLEDDQSKFDQHIGKSAFRALFRVYKHCLPRRVWRLLRRKVSVGGMTLGVFFKVMYTMQSGWPDTSLGDTIINAIMKTAIHGPGGNWCSLICGDDSVTVTTLREIEKLGGLPGIIGNYTNFGMEVEASLRLNPLDVEYCSGRFLPQFDSFTLVPKTGKLLARSFWSTKEYSEANLHAWTNGVCNSLDIIGRTDPIIQSVSNVVRSQTQTRKVLKSEAAGNPYSVSYRAGTRPVDSAGIAHAYAHWYGLFSADVEHLCSNVSSQFTFDSTVRDSTLECMVRADTPLG